MHLVGSGSNDIERCCPLDPKHCGCIQHTSLGSLYSDCGNQSGREDVEESASALEDSRGSCMVSCHVQNANREDKLQVDRCRRSDGKRWRCRKKVQPGSIYCEHHHIMRRGGYKAKVVGASKAGEKSPSIGPSEAISAECVLKEEKGLYLEPADGSLQVSTAQSVATSCKLFTKEELIEAQCETKPSLYTLESHNSEDARRSKTEEKLSELGQSVTAMAAMQAGQKEKPSAPHQFGEEMHDGKEETKQYLCRLGRDEHEVVESLKTQANSTGTVERTIDERRQKEKPDLNNALEEEVPKEEEEKGEHHHLRGPKACVEDLGMVLRADVDSELQAPIISFKALTGNDVEREPEEVSVKISRLATGPFGGSIAQVVVSPSNVSREEKSRKVQKEMSLFLPGLELNDLEGVQRSKKRPKLIGHGLSISLEMHNEQEETKPEQHVLEKIRYGAKQETAPKLCVVEETCSLDDVCRANETSRLAGHGQMINPEKPEHEDQKTAEVCSPLPASDGLDHVQISQGVSMPGFFKSSMMLVPKKEASYSTSEDGSKMHRGKGFHIEPSNRTAVSEISFQNPKRRLVEQGDSSQSTQALFPDGSLCVSKKRQSPTVSNDSPGQCHRNDGKGWRCSRQCQPGCMYCEHHEGRLSGTSGRKKMILQLELDKHVLATCLKGSSETQILRVAIDVPETLAEGLKMKVSSCTDRPSEGTTATKDSDALPLGRCHRKDGKGWQCAQQCKRGSIYCDRHQRQRSRNQFPCVHSQHKLAFSRGPDVQSQDSEARNGMQDDVGLALLSLRTPVGTPARAFHGSCLWEAKPLEQIGKADDAPNKCHRKDGKKWQCSQLCMPGYNHCEHHQGRGRKMKVIKT